MAHGVTEVHGEGTSVKMVHQKQQQHQPVHHNPQQQQQQQTARKSVGVMGSRRIFAPAFKLKVLDSYRNDIDCRGNQRATARKYGIHRRQIQKWLQCEDNLRNSCAETGSTGAGPTSVVSSAGVSKPDGTVTEATGPAVTPAAPALNLSLARLHGDELTAHQGPPPLLPHPPSHASAPPSPQYASQTSTTTATPAAAVLPLRVGYQDYPPASHHQEDSRHLHRDPLEERVQVSEVHVYPETRLMDQQEHQRTYYLLNSEGQREHETSFDTRNEVKVYQTLTSYRLPRPDHRYGNEPEATGPANLHRRSPASHRHSVHEQNYADVESSSIDEKSYGLLLAPSMIKTERASPDSAATPGPCELASSPGASRVPLSPLSSHQTISNSSSSSSSSSSMSSNASVSSISVHSDSPQASASPCFHVHMHEHAHGSPTPDSEKPIPACLHQQERAANEAAMQVSEKGTEGTEVGGAVVKEELHLEEEETSSEARGTAAAAGGREGGASSCTDYQRPPAGSSLGGSRPVSPVHDREGGYSLPSSPRGGPSGSERSSSSCSDSEMDPLDCSPGSQSSSNDLTRRRSFSLRFKLDVLDAFHRDVGVAGNQRATARKFGINRRQVQKWLGQETELRGEIALRGNSRQRLGPVQDAASGESPVDLRTTNYVSSLSHDRIEPEYERSPPPVYCCDAGSSSSSSSSSTSSQHLPYYQHHPAALDPSAAAETTDPTVPGPCNLSCCVDNQTAGIAATAPCYQELSIRGTCYAESQNRMYCYSPRDYPDIGSIPESTEEMLSSSPLKRQHCNLSCCYEPFSPPKRLCLDPENSCQETPPQDTPLCLVKPKRSPYEPSPLGTEPVTSTVPTLPVSTPAPPAIKKDAILFKPYLDNPVSKPAKEHVIQRGLSPLSSQSVTVNNNNNNNCQSICNLNEGRGHDYALELSLRLPVSWRTHSSPYAEFPQLRSAFVRYPASPHYT